jgi:hypothetical protein
MPHLYRLLRDQLDEIEVRVVRDTLSEWLG